VQKYLIISLDLSIVRKSVAEIVALLISDFLFSHGILCDKGNPDVLFWRVACNTERVTPKGKIV